MQRTPSYLKSRCKYTRIVLLCTVWHCTVILCNIRQGSAQYRSLQWFDVIHRTLIFSLARFIFLISKSWNFLFFLLFTTTSALSPCHGFPLPLPLSLFVPLSLSSSLSLSSFSFYYHFLRFPVIPLHSVSNFQSLSLTKFIGRSIEVFLSLKFYLKNARGRTFLYYNHERLPSISRRSH